MTRLSVLILTLLFGTEHSFSDDPCPSGTYRNLNTLKCTECTVGFVPNSDQTACEACPSGKYRYWGMLTCMPCASTMVSSGGAYKCTPCPSGTMANDDNTRCQNCNAGTYRGTSMLKCERCPTNMISRRAQAEYCTSCGERMTPNSRHDDCEYCPRGTYKDKTTLKCVEFPDCPMGTTRNYQHSACVSCPSGTFRNDFMDECAACPNGTTPNPWHGACDEDKYNGRKWSPVKRNVMIDFDPKNSIEIRTYSTPITDSQIQNSNLRNVKVEFYDSMQSWVGEVNIGLFEDPKYYISSCSQDYTKFPVRPSNERNKIWRITVSKKKGYIWILIHCNRVEVLDIVLHHKTCYSSPYSFGAWSNNITHFRFSLEDGESDYYRFFNSDVIPEENGPCPDNAYHCASGECWVKEELKEGVFANNITGYDIAPCLCIIDGRGKEADYLRNNTVNYLGYQIRYPMVQSIQCKEKGSDDMTLHKDSKVTCGWFFKDQNDWDFFVSINNYWSYGRTSGIRTVGTPHDCPDEKTWKIAVIVLSSVAFLIILIVIIWKLRKKGYCGGNTNSSTHQAIPSDTNETPPQRPSNPAILIRTASIPTYKECLAGSDCIFADPSNYVTLPTDQPPKLTDNDGKLGELPPTYDDVKENQNLYTVA